MTERAASSPRGTGSLADALARVPAGLKAEARWVCWRRDGVGFVFGPDRAYTELSPLG